MNSQNTKKEERIFISYKRVDSKRVFALKDEIEQITGEKCWIDIDGIESNAQFVDKIVGAIDKCDIFLFMRSKEHNKIVNTSKDWTIREVNYAIEENKNIIFLNLDNTPMPKWFKFMFPNQQEIDATDPDKLHHLYNDLCSWLQTDNKNKTNLNNKTYPSPKRNPTSQHWIWIVVSILTLISCGIFGISKYQSQQTSIPEPEQHYQDSLQQIKKQDSITNITKTNTKTTETATKQSQNNTTKEKKNITPSKTENNITTEIKNWNKKGDDYYNMQNYTEAVKWYQKAAEQGYARAQNNLGICYEYGNGVDQNYTEAFKWYQKAAEQGDAHAQNNLGFCYELGNGITQDYTEAFKWYQKAAEQGYATAQCNLGICYEYGNGVDQNYTEAFKWYQKAAEQGYARAQCNLGYCYYHEKGITKNYTEAFKWYQKAAKQGYARAQNNLGLCYELGNGITQDYTEAFKWYQKAAEQGYATAQYNLGICYEYGRGIAQNYTEAVKWYQKAAKQGNELAKENLKNISNK